MRQVVFFLLLLVVLAGCESTGRKISTSTSEEYSSKKAIPQKGEGEGVQEPIFMEPEEVPLPSGLASRSQELEQASAEGFPAAQSNTVLQERPTRQKKRIVIPDPYQSQMATPVKPIQTKTLQDIYFAFDKSTISSSAKPTLEANAELFQTRYKNRDFLIEGHCDERGSMEYNLVLGARRAQLAKDYLVDLGIHQSRIRIVSYGKERPVCSQAHASCWRMNRRAHFVLR